jgi:hypothetical protein
MALNDRAVNLFTAKRSIALIFYGFEFLTVLLKLLDKIAVENLQHAKSTGDN